ncbi:hypothetical protein Egran_00003 [Elaphomyces granulatus]|uniref:Uncharacterized protein n=1 Tax=Elaphomyces granulatus TaxID=519963 RepID=A0A232M776_9EURO|nr:hypothetical protein Egran_00003 [Elaphomyces granulatus]
MSILPQVLEGWSQQPG